MTLENEIRACQQQIEQIKEKIEGIHDQQDEQALATASQAQGISTCSFVSKMKERKQLRGHFGKIYAMDWGPDSDRLVSAAQDGKLIIWNAMLEVMSHAISLRSSWVMACSYSPDGSMVASGGLDNMCSVFKVDLQNESDATTSGASQELTQHEGYLSSCKFLNSNEILTSSGDATCILWDIESQTEKVTFKGHESDVMSVAHFQSNDWFITGSCDATAKLWDLRAGSEPIRNFHGHESDINCVQFLPDGQSFGSVSDDSTCRIFDIRSYSQLNVFADDHIICGITSCAFSHSGRLLFAGYDDYTCYGWDTLTGERAVHLDADDNRISCLGVNSDGNALATGSWSTRLKIFA